VRTRVHEAYARIRDGHYAHLKPQHAARLSYLYALDRLGRRDYHLLTEAELLATRTSDTAFVFGSGRSLVDIGAAEWERIAECGTISLREFPRQRWVRVDYHVTGEVDFLEEYAQRFSENPLYAGAVFVVQGGWRAERGNELIGRRLLPAGARLFRFRRIARGIVSPPSRSLRRGLVHGFNSIFDATNLAALLGFRRIVLAGVDLYNKEYFWLDPGAGRTYEKPGVTPDQPFGASAVIVDMMGLWRDVLVDSGVELLVHNPRSLLAKRLPVFAWDDGS
jgi:hypothetical protein